MTAKPVEVVVTKLAVTENNVIEFHCRGEHLAPSLVISAENVFFDKTRVKTVSRSDIRRWSKLLGIRDRFEYGRSFQLPTSTTAELCVSSGDTLRLGIGDEIVIARIHKNESVSNEKAGQDDGMYLRIRVSEFR
jgi:hypothetical protein